MKGGSIYRLYTLLLRGMCEVEFRLELWFMCWIVCVQIQNEEWSVLKAALD